MYTPVVQQNTTTFLDVSASKYDGDTSLTAPSKGNFCIATYWSILQHSASSNS